MAQIERQGTGWWRLVVSYGGRRWVRALETQDEREAMESKLRVERNLRLVKHGVIPLNPGDDLVTVLLSDGRLRNLPEAKKCLSLGELIEAYKTARSSIGREQNTLNTEDLHLSHILRLFGENLPLDQVSRQIQSYIDRRSLEGSSVVDRKKTSRRASNEDGRVARSTIRRELTTLGTIWNRWAIRQGYVHAGLVLKDYQFPKSKAKPPFQTWKQISKKVAAGASEDLWDSVFLDVDQIRELINFVARKNNHLATAMFAFAALTGARRAEMRRSRVEDFELGGPDAHVLIREKKKDRTKSITFRKVSLPAQLQRIMREWLGHDGVRGHHPGGPYTFCRPRINRHGKSVGAVVPLTEKMAYSEFVNALAGSKWQVLRGWHTLRHSLISNLASAGKSERLIMEIAGHLNEETSRRYQHLLPNVVKEAMSIFDEKDDDDGRFQDYEQAHR